MGSVPLFSMNLVIRRLSNTWLETGDNTGSSGTSLQTGEEKKQNNATVNGVLVKRVSAVEEKRYKTHSNR